MSDVEERDEAKGEGEIVSGSFDVRMGDRMAARKGDLIDHGGLITTGCSTVVINGASLLAARVTDSLECPSTVGMVHTGGSILPEGFPTVLIGGLPAARVGDKTLCVGPAENEGGGSGGGGGGSPEEATSECAKLWEAYRKEAEAIIAPGDGDHRERNKIISAAYADLCMKNPEFQWAGLAAYASKQVGCAMDYALKVRARSGRAGAYAGILITPAGAVAGAAAGVSAQYTYVMLGHGNRELFLDVYPIHRFYQEHGFAKLHQCAGERVPPLAAEALDGFRALDLYKRTGDKAYLKKSVASLAWHEQVNILQRDIYNDWTFRKILWMNEKPLGVTLPAEVVMGSGCTDPTGGERTHKFGVKGRTRLYDTQERMTWILKEIAPDYETFAGSKRHTDDLEVIRRQGEMAGGKFP